MADAFEQFLAASLAPPERMPDRRFVSAVHSRILLEDRLAAERRTLVADLIKQLAALIAVAAALWFMGRAAPAAEWFAQHRAAGLAGLLVAFGLLVALLSRRSSVNLSASNPAASSAVSRC
jgi:hypothetical protein